MKETKKICFNYNDFREAFIAGYRLRAEMSGLLFDSMSEFCARSEFTKWYAQYRKHDRTNKK